MYKFTILTILCAVVFINQRAIAQCTSYGTNLATSYVSNNSNKGEMFNIVATNTVTIFCFDLNLILGSTGNYEIYYKVGSYVGSDSNPAAWTLIGSNPSVPCVGFDVPSPMNIPVNIVIPAGQTYGFYITATDPAQTAGIRYTNNAGYTTIASDANISINGGIGKAYPFGTNFANRSFNGTVHYAVGNALPVSFKDFTATAINQSVVLAWETESEKSNNYFEIERSTNGTHWQKLFTTKAIGESSSPTSYQEVDADPLKGTSYYRLSQTDLDGKSYLLKTISWNQQPLTESNKLHLFPNPTTNFVSISGESAELAELVVLNQIGQDITSQLKITAHSGYTVVDFSNQQKGIFILKSKTLAQILVKE
ncbi:MAG: hypothetical protein ACO1N0_13680 [Fluviicola sp.]